MSSIQAAEAGNPGQAAHAAQAAEAPVVAKFGVFEIKLTSLAEKKLANPFWDARAAAEFTAPSGGKTTVEGFHYGGDEWRVRFVPREHGQWQYTATLTSSQGAVEKQGGLSATKKQGDLPAAEKRGTLLAPEKRGAFVCRGTEGRGFLRISVRNPFRLEYEDGTPFYPIGAQTTGYFKMGFDGPNEDGTWRTVTAEEWAKAFAGAVNLRRVQFGPGTTASSGLALIPAPPRVAPGTTPPPAPPIQLDRYDTDLAARIDDVYRFDRRTGFSQILNFFPDMSFWGGGGCAFGGGRDLSDKGFKSVRAANLPLQGKYIRYIVARYGCYVDIWEFFNEDSYAPNDYLAHLAAVVRRTDPYGHLITTNYARPQEKWCELITFHEYMGMPPNEVDAYLAGQFALYKSYGKPVVNTEFGNQGQLSNYDPVKWRIAVWTAFMNESSLLFWDMSGIKTKAGRTGGGGNANAYLGPESRQFFRVLNEFNRDMPIDMRPVPIGYHEHTDIRTYALSNGAVTAVYVHHFADHEKEFQYGDALRVQTGPGRFRARWIDPADGKELKTEELKTVHQYLDFRIPAMKIDAACRIDRLDPPPAP